MPARVRAVDLESFCRGTPRLAGAGDQHPAIAAEPLAIPDSWGVFTHGSKLRPGHARRPRAGGLVADVEPRILAEGPAWAVIDGGSAPGQVVGPRAMDEAMAPLAVELELLTHWLPRHS